jgi:hypothetical protein
MENAFPVADILFAKRGVKAEGVAGSGDVGRWRAFA